MVSLKGKRILVTGGTGTVGRELVRYLFSKKPEVVRIYSRDESKQFELIHEFGVDRDDVRFLIGDVRDKDRLRRAMEEIDIVFHAAALKHVYSCEYNPFEAIKTNVFGIQNVIDAAMEENVSKVIFTSSDKAANPSNVMGTTKLLGEKLITAANYYKGNRKTVFTSVRFGNVVGSRGSIVPLFLEQIKKGGPVTITHPDMTRFVMGIDDAVKLIINAADWTRGGEVFVSKMDALRIADLIDVMIEDYAPKFGFEPSKIKVKTIGVKAGEKLYEELMTDEEATRCLETEDAFILLPQLKELLPARTASWMHAGAKPMRQGTAFKSCDAPLMSNEDIRKFLARTVKPEDEAKTFNNDED